MLANQILHKTITDIQRIVQADCSVWNIQGKCLASTEEVSAEAQQQVSAFVQEEKEEWITETGAYFLIKDGDEPMYVLAIYGAVEYIEVVGRLCACQLESLIPAYKKRVDRNQFFQNLLLDNLLMVDVYNQAKKLNIEAEAKRVVFVIEPKKEGDNLVLETMKGLYATGTKDYVTAVDEVHIILIKNLQTTEDYKEINHMAKTIADTLNMEAMVDVRVAYGTIVNELREVSRSYKEACMALDVGRIFYAEKNVLAYNELGIGRLIHQLPYSLCEMFLEEVFHGKAIEQFDDEILTTVNVFFENSLNISETARKLYVHRNTLGYRLEKILKITGLDVRKFDDALTFKIAMMVSSHMRFIQLED
ncbi:MAG: helix-turn-helix domain-containing protein [Tyzzerella sp.]|nr:helix-turn-helix domain-containing protein [Tyzzerella sp.]